MRCEEVGTERSACVCVEVCGVGNEGEGGKRRCGGRDEQVRQNAHRSEQENCD